MRLGWGRREKRSFAFDLYSEVEVDDDPGEEAPSSTFSESSVFDCPNVTLLRLTNSLPNLPGRYAELPPIPTSSPVLPKSPVRPIKEDEEDTQIPAPIAPTSKAKTKCLDLHLLPVRLTDDAELMDADERREEAFELVPVRLFRLKSNGTSR